MQPASPMPFAHEFVHLGFNDGAAPAFDHLHLGRIHIDADNTVPQGGKARRGH
jgi:hypothetical protein